MIICEIVLFEAKGVPIGLISCDLHHSVLVIGDIFLLSVFGRGRKEIFVMMLDNLGEYACESFCANSDCKER